MDLVIIEDEPLAATRLKSLVKDIDSTINVITTLDSIKSAVAWFKKNSAPQLILMDIQLGDGISFEIFDQVEVNAPIIFTTAYDEYAIKAFKVNSIDYLLKPIDKNDLIVALKKYESTRQTVPDQKEVLNKIGSAMQMLTKKYKERFVTKVGEHLKFIEIGEILFFFSLDKVTFCKVGEGRKHILDYTLDQVELMIDPALFFRINRKYIVSINSIADMITHSNSRLKLVLKSSDDADVIVARERVQDFKNWLDS